MFWRYLFLIFLLGVPSSRIFTSANLGPGFEDDEIVDSIVQGLTRLKSEESGAAVDKKDDESNDQQDVVAVNPHAEEFPQATLDNEVPKDDAGTDSDTNKNELKTGVAGETARLHHKPDDDKDLFDRDDQPFILVTVACAVVGLVGLMMAGVCYYKFRKNSKAATDVEYPAYGVTGPMKERVPSPGDRKLAQSAQMYHYQHQKQQMIAMEKANGDMKHDASDDDSEEDNVEGDYTVYECPGLAPTGEMEVKNPLFRGDETPVTPNQETASQPQAGSPQGGEH